MPLPDSISDLPAVGRVDVLRLSPEATFTYAAAFVDLHADLRAACRAVLDAVAESRAEFGPHLEMLRYHCVAALGTLNLSELQREDPDGWSLPPEVSDVQDSILRRNRAFVGYIEEIVALARESDVEVLVRKGLPLAVRARGHLTAREPSDIDLLVKRSDAARLIATLDQSGFRPKYTRAMEGLLAVGGQNLGDRVRDIGGDIGRLDIGFSTSYFDRRSGFDLPIDGVFERATTVSVGGVDVPVASEVDFAIDVSAHFAKDAQSLLAIEGGYDLLLYKFSDVARLARRLAGLGSLEAFTASVHEHGLAKPILHALWCARHFDPKCVDDGMLRKLASGIDDFSYLSEFGRSEGYDGRWRGADADIVARTFDHTRMERFSGQSRLLERALRARLGPDGQA